ncbi:MAG: hypothetical protein PUG48_10430 [Clostridia bacterium]|nr:hypothetical protein [Clostridia bacterium]
MDTPTIDRHTLEELKHNAQSIEGYASDLMHDRFNMDTEDRITLELLYTFTQKELTIIDGIAAEI